MCQHQTVCTDYSMVCVLCGIEVPVLVNCTPKNVGFSARHQRFAVGYNRENRFRKMVTQIIFPSLSPINNEMIEFLFSKQISTYTQLLKYVKIAPVREKRFHALHAYSKAVLNEYVHISSSFGLDLIERLCKRFRFLELRFHQQNETRGFINYRFLLHFMFGEMGLDQLKKYVPRMKCRRRRRYYENLVKRLDTSIHVNLQ